MTNQQKIALIRLTEALEHHDFFTPQPDDTPVFLVAADETLYELPYHTGTTGQLKLGDLRVLATLLEDAR